MYSVQATTYTVGRPQPSILLTQKILFFSIPGPLLYKTAFLNLLPFTSQPSHENSFTHCQTCNEFIQVGFENRTG